jgi:hypothetical protein
MVRVRSRVWSCGICNGAGFLRVLRFPLPILIPPIAPQSPSSIIWSWYNRPVVAAEPSGLSLTPLRIIIQMIILYREKIISYFCANFTSVSVSETIQCRRVAWLVSEELKIISEQVVMACEVLSRHVPTRTEETTVQPQDSLWSGRDSNRAPPEYRSGALLLHQPADFIRRVMLEKHIPT